MAVQKCDKCGFNITDLKTSCPNCGSPYHPGRRKRHNAYAGLRVTGILGICASVMFALFLQSPLVMLAVLPSLFLAVLGQVVNKSENTPSTDSLMEYEKRIDSRISEIEKRRIRMQELKIRIDASINTESIQKTKNIIEHGEKILEIYRMKYEIEKRRIWLIRWKNSYEPYIQAALAVHTGEDITEIDALKQILDIGKAMYEEISSSPVYEREGSGAALLEDFRSSISSCQLIYETLINRQAISVLEEVSPLDAESASNRSILDSESGATGSASALISFRSVFDRLEYEYLRIKAEEELNIHS